ncbi:MAG: electron transfer flavoprotein subunit alpha/FixB family protein [Candidatus Hydrogenedentes bacterium]|nr:electron transfer flavoprotein subunit alpha/FixB family protein [Candidatus Hydrogenedentota bacterium]
MGVLVLLEQRGALKPCALEAASAAAAIARDAGLPLHAAFIGQSLVDDAEALAGFGIDTLYAYENDRLGHYSSDAYAPIVRELAREIGATVIVGSATALGRELCASVAARLGVELVQDAIACRWDGALKATKPVYAGKVLSEVAIQDSPAMVSLRPNTVAVTRDASPAPRVERRPMPEVTLRTVVRDVVEAAAGSVELTEAKIVVSAGRGIGGPENLHVVEDLAKAFGAALGASRAIVDAGWIHHAHQVGQTGKVVSPDLYVACGVSGAIQHQAGMRTAKVIVAINKDPQANIFKICDYGIVGDLFEVCPLLAEAVRQARG